MQTLRNYYLKDDGSHERYMSGLPIPCESDGICRNVTFESCNFHPACSEIQFENCTFDACDFQQYIQAYKMKDCTVIHACSWCHEKAEKKLITDSPKIVFYVCAHHITGCVHPENLRDL